MAERRICLKCLSAFGFWGTGLLPQEPKLFGCVSNAFRLLGSGEQVEGQTIELPNHVSNAFRLLGSGEHDLKPNKPTKPTKRLKCLSAFGFWGTPCPSSAVKQSKSGLKCLSAFGFWGTEYFLDGVQVDKSSLKCLSAFGFWGTSQNDRATLLAGAASQMPFGFWVLGNFYRPILKS